MKKKNNNNKIKEGALDVGIQSYPISSNDSENKTITQLNPKTANKSTSGFKKNARVFTNPQNLKKTLDTLKDKEVEVVVTDGVEDKVSKKLEYVSEVIDEGTGQISKPFTIGTKNYQMVRAMGPENKIVMGVYAFDEMDESGNCKIYEVDEFEGIAKSAINELGVQEPEGPEAATLNPLNDIGEKETKATKETNPSFEGYKHFIVNEKLGKVKKFKTIQELAKAKMDTEETYMGIKEFKKYIDSALFGKRKMKEETVQAEVIPSNITTSIEKTMKLIGTKLTSSILQSIKQNPIAQEQMILAFAEQIGVPANRLSQLINGIKNLAQEVNQQNPSTSQQGVSQVSERTIIKVKDLK